MHNKRMNSEIRLYKWFYVFVIVIIAIGIFFGIRCEFNEHEYVVTITDKDRITDSSKDSDGNVEVTSKYIIFADDENGNPLVFENTDDLFHGKFNSSNFQSGLKIGHTYRIKVIGIRWEWGSWYENIISYEEIIE